MSTDQVQVSAENAYGRESILINSETKPKLRAGEWFFEVLEYLGYTEDPAEFSIVASFEKQPPEALLEIPSLPRPKPGKLLEPALCAVVEVYASGGAGSGTFLTKDGWLLTNAHVVADYAEGVLEDVVVAPTLERDRPTFELFRGKVHFHDTDLDLALIKVDRGFYDQPVPPGYEFPTVELGDAEDLSMGEQLWVVGYPVIGGSGSRVPITATRGIVCGFERTAAGRVIKTDAEITHGNSGGAALDQEGRLVGVPTEMIEESGAQMGYVFPISRVPAEWWLAMQGEAAGGP
jgi:S1-C subfamily serine protease